MSSSANLSLDFSDLLKKYDVPVPRYTSYPTVPAWKEAPTQQQWISSLRKTLEPDHASWSMYLHLPFCETLCTFCGCNTIITKDHSKSNPYIDLILKEWQIYQENVESFSKRELKHIHLGGGTPTFLTAVELGRLIESLFKNLKISSKKFEASIEVDPRRTNSEQLQVLKSLGFDRVSLGVQDFNPEVQKIIHREQPFEMTKKMTDEARALGYSSVNFDLIYGLPLQTHERMVSTIEKTLQIRPDRIAFYSFALVPWIKPAQRLFKDSDLPESADKRKLYETAREMFFKAGYIDIGMDHFALPTDSLAQARKDKTLHRNFMGYTDQKTDLLLGLGVSSISESADQFHQNEKLLPKYQEMIEQKQFATHRGHLLSDRDQLQRQKILQMMTQYEYKWQSQNEFQSMLTSFSDFLNQGLVDINENKVVVLEKGRPFLRNICSLFDDYLPQNRTGQFSKSI